MLCSAEEGDVFSGALREVLVGLIVLVGLDWRRAWVGARGQPDREFAGNSRAGAFGRRRVDCWRR